jgi:hypothetical protein
VTTSAAGGSSWREVAAARVAHLMLPLLGLRLGLNVLEWGNVLPGLNAKITMIVTVVLMVGIGAHLIFSTSLCVQCMAEVPDDAPVRAVRQRWLLWVLHRFTSRRGIAMLLLVISIECWVGTALYGDASMRAGTAGNWVFMPSDLWLDVGIYSFWLHHKLLPWCPYCKRWGDGGVHEQVPDPDPSMWKVS